MPVLDGDYTHTRYTTDLIGNTNYSYATGVAEDGDPVWKDQLINYNGTTIRYDAIGNPLNWGPEFPDIRWSRGNRLVYLQNRSQMVTYTYDESGLRTRKYNGSEYTYYDRDAAGNLVHETRNNGKDHLYYYYDANGSIGSISYNGVRYAFLKNLQGDVVAILDTNSNIVARYTYDAWGRILSITDGNGNANTSSSFIGNVNPIRYRGYYYDTETGWYYLNSRYYDPEVKRFINADNQLSADDDLIGKNLYAYCGNNPVNRVDPTGEAWWHWVAAAAVVAVCAVAVVATAGGVAAGVAAVAAVGNGVAAATTASTIAAGSFIGSATALGVATVTAAATSNSVKEFNDKGNWGTVAATAGGAVLGGASGYVMSKAQSSQIAQDDEPFLPDSFYSKHAPKQSTPNSSYTNYTYNNYTEKYEQSTAYYDFAGRQTIRIDWTNHGYSSHGNPHVHYTTYNSQYRDGITIRWD